MFLYSTLSLRRLLFLAVGLLTLVVCVFASTQAFHQWQRVRALQSLHAATTIGDQLFNVTEKIAVEREVTFAMLRAPDPETAKRLRPEMLRNRREADAEIESLLARLESYTFDDVGTELKTWKIQVKSFHELRKTADAALGAGHDVSSEEAVRFFESASGVISATRSLWMTFMRHYVQIDSLSSLQMRLKHLLGNVMEYTGRQRSMIAGLIVGSAPATPLQQAQLLRWKGISDASWDICVTLMKLSMTRDANIAPFLAEARSHYTNGYNMVRGIFYTPGVRPMPPYMITIDLWLELSYLQIESMHELKEAALDVTRRHSDALIAEARNAILLQMLLVTFSLAFCGFIFYFIDKSVIRPIAGIVDRLHRATKGEELLPVAAGKNFHEIDKLVQVLAAFQAQAAETRKTAQELARHAAQLEQSNAELDQFAYVASHDLKAPLRGIDNLAVWIEEDAGPTLPQSARDNLKILRGRVSRLEGLLSGILSYSRAGRIVEEMVNIDTTAMVRQVAETWVPPHFNVTIDPLPVIKAPPVALEQVFGNLLSNAAKHHDKLNGEIRVSAMDAGKFWRFSVTDDGPGIPEEFHKKVFEMFRTLKPRDVVEGTGLGMPIAKKLIEAMGGKIWIESRAGERGTTFCILWPKQDA